MSTTSDQGKVLILSAASGTGKSSLAQALIDSDPRCELSISHTTRDQRAGEVDGVDYHFVSEWEFERRIDAGEFLEYAKVFGNFYGTSRTEIEDRIHRAPVATNVVLDIDWQGAQQVRQFYDDYISVFLLPPSIDELEIRMRKRGRDSDAIIQDRLAQAVGEMNHFHEFEHLVVNDDFNLALADLQNIVDHNSSLREVPENLLGDLGVQIAPE